MGCSCCSCCCCCCPNNEEEEKDLLQEEIKHKSQYVQDNCANEIKIYLKEGENLSYELFKTYNKENKNENDNKNKINKVENKEAKIQEENINTIIDNFSNNNNNNQNKYIMFSITYAKNKQEKVKEDDKNIKQNNFRVKIKLCSNDEVKFFIDKVGGDVEITKNEEIKNILINIKEKFCDIGNLVVSNNLWEVPKVDDNVKKYILAYLILDCFVKKYLDNIEKNNIVNNKKENNDTLFKQVLDKINENIKLWNDHNSSKNNKPINKNNLENINNSNNNININNIN